MTLTPEHENHPVSPMVEPGERSLFTPRMRTAGMLIGILLIAAFFRFYGSDYDQGHNQHPDERYIVGKTIALTWPVSFQDFFDPQGSSFNLRKVDTGHPQGDHYPYGSFPVYLVKGVGWVADNLLPKAENQPPTLYSTDYNGVTKVGRILAAIFDLVTILLVFFIARRLYSRNTGLVAAALVAFAVTHIQIAHFYASDVFLVTFMMGALYFSVVMMQRPSWWAAIGAGACIGLAVASKVSVVPFALIVVAAVALRTVYRKRTRKLGAELGDPIGVRPASAREREMSAPVHFLRGLVYVLIAAVFSFIFFSISEPYVILIPVLNYLATNGIGSAFTGLALARDAFNASPFWGGIVEQAAIQSGQADVPYTRQYVGTVPLLYHLQNMVLWGLSPLPGVVAVIGFAIGLGNAVRRRPAEVLLMAGALPYFATILTLEAKWMRYMLPLVPIFCILGAALLMRGVAWMSARAAVRPYLANSRRPALVIQRNAFKVLTFLAVGGGFLWAVAFMNIYSQEHSRVQASRWIYDNVPTTLSENGVERQTHTSGEEWDDLLPLDVAPSPGKPAHNNGAYAPVNFRMYEDPPPDQEFEYIKSLLPQDDYIFIASNRLYGSLRHLPWRYPVQNKFYELLYGGKLGYELVHTTHITPQLFGVNFDDQTADESFTVYDHPRVDIFKKTANLADQNLQILFSSALNRPAGAFSRERHGTALDDKSLQYDQPLSRFGVATDYAWNPLAQPDTQWIGVLLWLLLAEALGLIALPIIFTVCRNLPDKGYPLAKIAGLVLLAWGVWVVSSAKIIPFTLWGTAIVGLMLLALSYICWKLGARAAISLFAKTHGKLIVYYEVLFLITFVAFLFVRILNPDLWHPSLGGEKTMEFGFLNSSLRSPWMPPPDPFFAGGYINYYYYGQFVTAVLIKILGMDPALGINLAIPLFYAFTFTAGASIVYNIVAWSQGRREARSRVSGPAMAFGVLAGVLMLAIGNMHGAFQLLMITDPARGNGLIDWARNSGFTEQSMLSPVTSFDFWGPSRIIAHTINEFPFWSFLFADFHPHLIDMPFTMLAVGLSMNLAFAGLFSLPARSLRRFEFVGRSLGWLWGEGWSGALSFGLLAVTLGTLFATNSWDFPTYAGVAAAAVLVALLLAQTRQKDDAIDSETLQASAVPLRLRFALWATAALSVGALGIAALIACSPFLLSFKNVLQLGIRPLVDGGPVVDNPSVLMHRTTLGEFLFIWAIFVFVAFSYLIVRLWTFPWGRALRELAGASGERKALTNPSSRPATFGGEAAFSRLPGTSSLAPAFAGASGPNVDSGVLFSQEVRDETGEEARQGPTAYATPGGYTTNNAPISDPQVAAGDADFLNRAVPDDAPVEASDDASGPAHSNGSSPEGEEDATLVAPRLHWVTEAHDQSRVVAAVPPRERLGVVPLWAGLAMLAVTAGLVALQIATGQMLLALLIALIGGIAATTLSTSRSAGALFTGVLMVAALAVAMGVELVYLADHLRGGDTYRMNTVFKFYIQVWLLFGAASAAAVYYILFGVRDRVPDKAAATGADSITAPADYDTMLASPVHERVEESEYLARGYHSEQGYGDNGIEITGSAPQNGALANGNEPQGNEAPREIVQTGTLNNWLVWSNEADSVPAAEVTVPVEPALQPLSETPVPPASATAQPATSATTTTADPPRSSGLRVAFATVWTVLFALLLLASFVYTLYGTPARVAQRFPVTPPVGTLDGRAYMQYAVYGPVNNGDGGAGGMPVMINLKYDYEAIEWLNTHVQGLHVIAEGPYEYYRDGGMRAAANTGLPMIVGGLHQGEQRYDWLIGTRDGEARQLYSTVDPQVALTILSKYDVDYIYLGQLEQARAGAGLAKFDQMVKAGLLKQVFKTNTPKDIPGTTIYQVVRTSKISPEKVVGAAVQGSGIPGISITPLPTMTPTPPPTPPSDNPELKALIDAVNGDPGNIEKHQKLVDWYRDNKYFADAARELEAMKKLRPQDIAIRHMLGDAYDQAGQKDKALAEWEAARDIEPDNPAAHNKLGIGYMDRHRYDEALTEFQAAVTKDPSFNEAYLHLGQVYDAKGEHDKALKAYQQCVDAWKNAPADRKPGMEGWAKEASKQLGK